MGTKTIQYSLLRASPNIHGSTSTSGIEKWPPSRMQTQAKLPLIMHSRSSFYCALIPRQNLTLSLATQILPPSFLHRRLSYLKLLPLSATQIYDLLTCARLPQCGSRNLHEVSTMFGKIGRPDDNQGVIMLTNTHWYFLLRAYSSTPMTIFNTYHASTKWNMRWTMGLGILQHTHLFLCHNKVWYDISKLWIKKNYN